MDERERIDALIDERLGRGAGLEPDRRRRLVGAVMAADADAPAGGRRILRLRWIGLGAAAAAVVALLLAAALRPKAKPEPIPPTTVLSGLLGPFARPAEPTEEDAPGPEADEAPLGRALATLWNSFEGPVSIGQTMLDAPRAVAPAEPRPPRHRLGEERKDR